MKEIQFNEQGLVPVIAQDAATGAVLMMAWMNREALDKTLQTGDVYYFSRSRRQLWRKGETSGHTQKLREMRLDCDGDCILIKIEQRGPACHTGQYSCFDGDVVKPLDDIQPSPGSRVLGDVFSVILDRKNNPQEGSYTNKLLLGGIERIAKKVGEEASEVIIGAMKRNRAEIAYETADLLYHLMVLFADQGMTFEEVYAELARRMH